MIEGIRDLTALSETTTNELLKNAIDYILSNLSVNTTQGALREHLKEVAHITNKASANEKEMFERYIQTLNEKLPGDLIVKNLVYTPMHDAAQPSEHTDKDEKTPLLGKNNKKEKKSKVIYF